MATQVDLEISALEKGIIQRMNFIHELDASQRRALIRKDGIGFIKCQNLIEKEMELLQIDVKEIEAQS